MVTITVTCYYYVLPLLCLWWLSHVVALFFIHVQIISVCYSPLCKCVGHTLELLDTGPYPGAAKPPLQTFSPSPEKICWALLKTIGHSLKNLGPSQKTLRHPWCHKLVTGLIGHSLKFWALSSSHLVFEAGYGPGQNRLLDWLFWRIIVMWYWSWDGYRRVVQKTTQTEFYHLIVLAGIL